MRLGVRWVEEVFDGKLIDLGTETNGRLDGVLSPIYDQQEMKRFMSKYYTSNKSAQAQVDKINLNDYYNKLIINAICKSGFDTRKNSDLNILEIGCGFGSATIPLISIFPNANFIASEFSIAMLAEMKIKLIE